jgi:formylglycine-generating enzyme required for sulfatase activity
MGVVFRAHDPSMARDVALKVLRTDPSLSPAERDDLTQRFEREAKAAGGLNHPNIVIHFERGEIGEHKYIVMELVEGRPLHTLMSQEPGLGVDDTLAILRQMAAALDYAHSRGVIHRDIKPANVLVVEGGTAKIADFGIAKCALMGTATASSMIIGSPHYMAPEQIEARTVTSRTDQWALAVTAYEMLTRNKPFQSDSVAGLFQQILAGAPADPATFDPRLPGAVKKVFGKALSKPPEERFENCTGFVDALAAALAKPATAAQVRRRGLVIKAKSVRRLALAAAIVLALASGGAWLAGRWVGRARSAAETAPATAQPRAGEVRLNRRDGMRYVWVAPGRFRMGCSEGDAQCEADEKAHEVTLTSGFWIGQTEVTTAAFRRYCRVGGGRLPEAAGFNSGWVNDSLPIENVTWDAAAGYCRWAEGRLPTEAEWEFAARAGTTTPVYGPLEQIAWSAANSGDQAREVGRKQANALGLFDMIGNVWEWTADHYHDGSAFRDASVNPRGPESGHFRVLRGGSWIRDEAMLRVSDRYPVKPDGPDHGVGFRCVLDEMP